MRRFWRSTVWASGAIPEAERKYAEPLKRFLFPVFDVVMLLVGIRGLSEGIPSIERIFPPGIATGYYWAVIALALICLVGAVFPRLWVLEISGKVSLFAVLTVYLVALRTVAGADGGARDAVSLLVFTAMLIPLLRLWILGIEIRDRKES